MATGEVAETSGEGRSEELEAGEAVMATGRLSIARRIDPDRPKLPFSPAQLARVDEALTLSSRTTGLEFAIYLGDLGEQTRERAEQLHTNLGGRAGVGVLIAVSPGQRTLEIVTGEEAYRRVSDRSCNLAVMSMVASFKEGNLIEGLLSGLRMLSDAAGTRPGGESGHH
ncbi:uncharacterized protein DUF5130 [Halopolyspora algeriensis]|uniref:Uncharacterized protein DUF5130 n=1 Tax=Halopolyspora algeriensis TaxID=1500506 RepID=A0A368VTM9_9ACTN|nr:DUF5130 family protein [Halopolyspora algeriensis]RCW45105.1 uncharacterized protein DUF5130 [Halopolyspora algeriensis]TQM53173.1 uncharacterized protein DUF5130 [Halopolyspora algeriensis]